MYADPPVEKPLWFREGVGSAVDAHERAQGWGAYAGSQGSDHV
jgi:hypothetical protein